MVRRRFFRRGFFRRRRSFFFSRRFFLVFFFVLVVLGLLFLFFSWFFKSPFPDISGWRACSSDADCVVSVNIMCADPYDAIDDSCINRGYLNKSFEIPFGGFCKYGVTACRCVDGYCFAVR